MIYESVRNRDFKTGRKEKTFIGNEIGNMGAEYTPRLKQEARGRPGLKRHGASQRRMPYVAPLQFASHTDCAICSCAPKSV